MKTYARAEVSEQELEDLVRKHAGMIEEGLTYLDHQRQAAGGRLDVLMVDSGRALVVAELKVTQDDNMLVQGLDYYNDISTHVETYARVFKTSSVDPTQKVRLILIAPSFSQALLNRSKWLDLPVSLFTYSCVKLEGDSDPVVVFNEHSIASPPEPIEVPQLDDHLSYITDVAVRAQVVGLLEEFKSWMPGHTTVDPIKHSLSLKVNNRLVAYLHARRKHYVVATWGDDDQWQEIPVRNDEDLSKVKEMLKAMVDWRVNGK